MAAKKRAAKAGKAAMKARYNPYVRRLAEDEDLRDNLMEAYESARVALGRLTDGKSPTKAIFDDRKLQKEVRNAAEHFRDASVALREAPKRRRRKAGGGLGKLLLVGIVGGGLALALSEGLRKKVLDALFGAEEEFEYTSTTTTSSPETAGTTT